MASVAQNAQQLVRESKLVSCKRCGESELAWAQTNSGKWILCPISRRKLWTSPDGDPSLPKGFVIAVKMRPHRCGERQQKADKAQEMALEYRHGQRIQSPEIVLIDAMSHLSKIASLNKVNEMPALEVLKDVWMSFQA